MQFTPVSRERHAFKSWRPNSHFGFAATTCLVPLVRAELPRMATLMPVAFIQEAGGYMPAAVLSLGAGENQFVEPDGSWLGPYVPAFLRSHPFRLMRDQERPADRFLCIDEQFAVVPGSSPDAQPFFDAEGHLAPSLRAVVDFLEKLERDRIATEAASAALVEARLIRPWQITIRAAAGEKSVEGLYRVDDAALNALDDSKFLELRRAGALPMAYAQLMSMSQLGIFERLDRYKNLAKNVSPSLRDLPPSLDKMFHMTGDDTLHFD
jgi:hypothetical protein